MKHIVIIGNGIAGITCARHIRKRSDDAITVISAESRYFYSRTALMYLYMGHMTLKDTQPYEAHFWEKNRIDLVFDYALRVDHENKKVILKKGEPLAYDKLVLATGSQSNKFGWPGQDLDGVQGLYSLQDLESLEKNTKGAKRAVIVGGGLIGVELAEMLSTRHIEVTFLVREKTYWGNVLAKEEGELVGRHMTEEHHIDIRLETSLEEIIDDDNGRCKAVRTDKGEVIPCDLVGLTAGVHPNLDLAKESGIPTQRGIMVNDYLETRIPDVYAAGDCAEFIVEGEERGRVEQLWYTGRMHGEVLAGTICGERKAYDRGIWFNSAKFFDIEYHTYGFVPNTFENPNTTYYWEHPEGKICLRLVFDADSRVLTGMNSFGIRYKHRIFEKWLREKRTVEYVLTHLQEANFDPEFYKLYEGEIIEHFNQTHNKNLKPPPGKRGFFFGRRNKKAAEASHA